MARTKEITQTSREVVESRVDEAKNNRIIKAMYATMRDLLAGDDTELGGDQAVTTFYLDGGGNTKDDSFRNPRMITGVAEGTSNDLLTWAGTLIDSITVDEPSFDFPDLDVETARVRGQYVMNRMFERGQWSDRQEKFLHMYLTDGVAFARIVMSNGAPALEPIDTMDVYWDMRADVPADYRYVAWNLRLPRAVAERILGPEAVAEIAPKGSDPDDLVKFIEYWDYTTTAYLSCGKPKLLKSKPNRLGFIPCAVMMAPKIPGIVHPIPPLLPAAGLQALSNKQRVLLSRLFMARIPRLKVRVDAIEPECMASINEDWASVDVIKLRPDAPEDAYAWTSMGQIESEIMALGNMLDSSLVRTLRVNPFATGVPPRTTSATADAQIATVGQLNHIKFARRYERFLSDAAYKLIKMGASLDELPFAATLEGEVAVLRGPALETILGEESAVKVTVSPKAREQEMLQSALVVLSQLSNPAVAELAPELAFYGVELLKRATGVKMPRLSEAQKQRLAQMSSAGQENNGVSNEQR